ncbi:MAG: hypothetical protein KJ623_00500 [Nanoarchaeota archaeon]|nr:hypothetical protein [Nanoarchaeota archaeon]MBU0963098.1 hypothetical protein [Nanoarchaeota archaeon]
MKKAQMQFNWAFVIIAGVIILAFFTTFIVRYIDIQTMKENAEISSDVYNILYSLQKSSFRTELNISIGIITDLEFSCDKLVVGNFAPASLKKEYIFAPKSMNTDIINVWMQSWKYPFKIANLFYLSSREKKYYIVYDQSSEGFVNNLTLPPFNIQKTTTMPNIDDPNVKIISFTSRNADITITPDENGQVIIGSTKYPLFGLPLVYGAMFSDNYPCILDRLLNKFLTMIEIYKIKVDYLYLLNRDCDYSQMKFTLNTLRDRIQSKNYDEIKKYVNILDEQNKNMLSLNCQPLY